MQEYMSLQRENNKFANDDLSVPKVNQAGPSSPNNKRS